METGKGKTRTGEKGAVRKARNEAARECETRTEKSDRTSNRKPSLTKEHSLGK